MHKKLLLVIAAGIFALLVHRASLAKSIDPWTETLDVAIPAVVQLHVTYKRSVDTEMAGVSTATGFVIDKKRGLVLTNRHVTGRGPVSIRGTFTGQQQASLSVLYRDPIHDFAVLQYSPEALTESPAELTLKPEKLSVGQSIRVIGADGGEQLSILSGIIAKLDREAPYYGTLRYNDYNTFYIQAASSTSGGSSGSPVINVEGEVVALNAGANTRTAASFYLPLPIIQDTIEQLQDGEIPKRGGLGVIWVYRPVSELARYGVNVDELVGFGRKPDGLLMAENILPDASVGKRVEVGDVLWSVNGEQIENFVAYERTLAGLVGQETQLEILRNGELIDVSAQVADLQREQLASFVEIGDTIFQSIPNSAMQSIKGGVSGVFVANAGYLLRRAGVPDYAIITRLGDAVIESLDDLIAQLPLLHQGQQQQVTFLEVGREHLPQPRFIEWNTHWFEARQCHTELLSDQWQCTPLALQPAVTRAPQPELLRLLPVGDEQIDRVLPRLVQVSFDVPHPIDNTFAPHYEGWGLLVDESQGLILADRNTVPVSLGDALVNLLDSVDVPAQVVMLHPRHNFALLKIDASWLASVEWPPLTIAETERLGSGLTFVGFDLDAGLFKREITRVEPYALEVAQSNRPRYMQVPADLFQIPSLAQSMGGVLFDDQGHLEGILGSYAVNTADGGVEQLALAVSGSQIKRLLDEYYANQSLFDLGFHAVYESLSNLADRQIAPEFLQALRKASGLQRRAPVIRAVKRDSEAASQLRVGDVVLEVSGEAISGHVDIDRAALSGALDLTVWRGSQAIKVSFALEPVDHLGTAFAAKWQGALLQPPISEWRYLQNQETSEIYIASVDSGSQADADGLYSNQVITAVNGVEVNTIEAFLNAVQGRSGDVVITTANSVGRKRVIAMGVEDQFSSNLLLNRTQPEPFEAQQSIWSVQPR
ncbi:MAG: trypsin-like peptidase domain-containing protein [Gammaproteobacteria bacterium]|nr:trypsin-like peptidase domain-containing protein [Gammaproteobacteria bacterium]